jgi:hypothetical protein
MDLLVHHVRNLKVLTHKELLEIDKLVDTDKMTIIKEYNNSIKCLIENLVL